MSNWTPACMNCGTTLQGKDQRKFCSRTCSSRFSRRGARQQRDDWNIKYVHRTGCWEWQGSTTNGYGRTTINRRGRYAHRHFFELYNRPLKANEKVCHSCDNRLCVNPEHLFTGSQADNIADMVAKGRQARGSKNAAAKLTDDQVVEIYVRRNWGEPLEALAREFGVGINAVSRIALGRSWKHATAKLRAIGESNE